MCVKRLMVSWLPFVLPIGAAAQLVPLGMYVDAGCFQGESIRIETNQRFTRLWWDDTQVRFQPPEPWTYRLGERGTYTVHADSLRLTFTEIVFDSVAIAQDLGDRPDWLQSPDEYVTQSMEAMNEASWVLLVRVMDGEIVLWNATQIADLHNCERIVALDPDTLPTNCYLPDCAGVLWKKE